MDNKNEFSNFVANWLIKEDDSSEKLKEFKKHRINAYKEKANLIDLHTHTCYSDGELMPNELLKLAISKGIGTISITDHDTLLGNKKIMSGYGCEETDFLNIIPGIELSAKTDKGRMHILGYNINIHDADLNGRMEELKNNSIYSVLAIVNQLKKDYGIILKTEDIVKLVSASHNIGRPDLAKLLVKYELATSSQNAFDRYLIEAHEKTRASSKGLPYEECIELILNAGGVPVLAHPNTLELNPKELLILIKKMITVGLKGIEAYHSSHTLTDTENYLKIAGDLNLVYSGGSDFHGSFVKPDVELGTGRSNNLNIRKLTLLDCIKK